MNQTSSNVTGCRRGAEPVLSREASPRRPRTPAERRGYSDCARSESGYVLLEVVLAVAVVAIALGVLIESLGRCLAAARSVQNYAMAETLLANKSAEFRTELASDTSDQEGEFEEYPLFKWSRTLEPADSEKLWKQTITITWIERGLPSTDSAVEYRYLPSKGQ
jgi:type II secretion system protein I